MEWTGTGSVDSAMIFALLSEISPAFPRHLSISFDFPL
jgi:hypothetical protein